MTRQRPILYRVDDGRPLFSVAKVRDSYHWAVWADFAACIDAREPIAEGIAATEAEALAERDRWNAAEYTADAVRRLITRRARARRAARPTTATGAGAVELLWIFHQSQDGEGEWWIPHLILRRTDRYVYVQAESYRPGGWQEPWENSYSYRLDRLQLERDGSAWTRASRSTFYTDAGRAAREASTIAPACLATLGLDATATADDVRRAYRRLARETHPDHGGDAERFHAVSNAYSVAMREAGR